MIGLYSGLPGEGKTLHLAQFAHRHFLAGKTIYSNFKLEFGELGKDWHFFYELEQLNNLKNALVVIDEGQIMFNCRRWENLSITTQYKLQCHRHDGLDLAITSQNFTRLDIEVRNLIHTHYDIEKIIESKKLKFAIFRKHYINPRDEAHKEILSSSFSMFNFRKPALYDTSADMSYLLPNPEADYFVKMKNCKCGKAHKIGVIRGEDIPRELEVYAKALEEKNKEKKNQEEIKTGEEEKNK